MLAGNSALGLGQELKNLCLWSTKQLWEGIQKAVVHLVCKILNLASAIVRDNQPLPNSACRDNFLFFNGKEYRTRGFGDQ